jgi:membrane protease YdiL (CAAX protease family)
LADRKPFPAKPVLVLAAIVAAVRLSLFLFPGVPLVSPSFLAAALFLYAPLPRYFRTGFPGWTSVSDPLRSARTLLILAGLGAAAFFLLTRIPLPPPFPPHWRGAPLSWPLAAHLLFLVALPEEVFFRGYLHDAFEEAGRDPVLPVALLFAAAHVAIAPAPFRALTFFPGLLFGWGRKASGNVYVPVAVHFLFNLYPSLIGGAA